MDEEQPSLIWSRQYTVSSSIRADHLSGDKLILSSSALGQLLAASTAARATAHSSSPVSNPTQPWRDTDNYDRDLSESQLPQPLTFRLLSPETGKTVYAGVQEFSADGDDVILSSFLKTALGLTLIGSDTDATSTQSQSIIVSAHQLPKGQYVKLRPLEAGYDPQDWKALLEQHLRASYTTLTAGQLLVVPAGADASNPKRDYHFLVETLKPDGDGVCIVDTDLEVDIEALNEEQARETVSRIIAKSQQRSTQSGGSLSTGGDLDLFTTLTGQVLPGQYVDHQLQSWPRDQPLTIRLEAASDRDQDAVLSLLVSPLSPQQRARPRTTDYVYADLTASTVQQVNIMPVTGVLQDAEAIWVSVWAYKDEATTTDKAQPCQYSLKISVGNTPADTTGTAKEKLVTSADTHDNETQCPNCQQWVPKASIVLHESFCRRNNILCPRGCGKVYQKSSQNYADHWHCPHDTFHGEGALSYKHHNYIYHPPEPLKCDRCSTTQTFSSIPLLSDHHVTLCPAKTILCRFCHLLVPQEGDPDHPSAEVLISGLTQHELTDGSRTTECHLCNRITRLRDLDTHMKHHDLERKSRARPRPCRNAVCGHTQDGTVGGNTRVSPSDNTLGLCTTCFSPLYVSLYDPEGKALLRRIERRYLQQLMTGCGKSWCANPLCKSGRKHASSRPGMPSPEKVITAKEALPVIMPYVTAAVLAGTGEMFFCVDSEAQKRMELAVLLEAEVSAQVGRAKGYDLPWCLGAVEAEGGHLDKARAWLTNWAPQRDEERTS